MRNLIWLSLLLPVFAVAQRLDLSVEPSNVRATGGHFRIQDDGGVVITVHGSNDAGTECAPRERVVVGQRADTFNQLCQQAWRIDCRVGDGGTP